MKKEIIHDEELLSIPAEVATAEDADVAQDLIDTISANENGISMLAANQIGSNKAIIAYVGTNDKIYVMYNPRAIRGMQKKQSVETCLSLEKESVVMRYQLVTIVYEELVNGELKRRQRKFTGFLAEAIQHGIDHCNGVLV